MKFKELFLSKVLEPNGIFVFHINAPEGKIAGSSETRESVYKNHEFPGFKLIKYLSQKEFAKIYHSYYQKDYGDHDNVLLMYQKINS